MISHTKIYYLCNLNVLQVFFPSSCALRKISALLSVPNIDKLEISMCWANGCVSAHQLNNKYIDMHVSTYMQAVLTNTCIHVYMNVYVSTFGHMLYKMYNMF